jgi:hypothetical protein
MSPDKGKEVIQVRNVWWIELLGSAFIFASVYLLLYIVYQATTALVASYFGLDSVLYMDRVAYNNGFEWYPHAVKRTFLVGAIFIGFAGITFYILYAFLRKSFIFVRLFMLWASVIAISMLAQRLIGVLISSNFEFRKLGELGFELAVFGAYMYYEQTTYWMMAFVGLLLLAISGFFIGKPFLQTAWSSEQIGSEHTRFNFLKYQVVLPFFLGSAVVTAITFPFNIISNAMAFTCVAFALVFAIVRAMFLGPMLIPRQRTWERWPIVPAVLLLVTLVAIKTVLRIGLHF